MHTREGRLFAMWVLIGTCGFALESIGATGTYLSTANLPACNPDVRPSSGKTGWVTVRLPTDGDMSLARVGRVAVADRLAATVSPSHRHHALWRTVVA